jgi:hypothetical protein
MTGELAPLPPKRTPTEKAPATRRFASAIDGSAIADLPFSKHRLNFLRRPGARPRSAK